MPLGIGTPKAHFTRVIELDAPGAGNWQGACKDEKTGNWFLFHARSRPDNNEDVIIYRFDKGGKYSDKMTLPNCTHPTSFAVDAGIVWLTWNDKRNDVVTFRYQANTKIRKSDTKPMHVFTDYNAGLSMSPTRAWAVIREIDGVNENYRRFRMADIVGNNNNPWGKVIKTRKALGRTVQGFSVADEFLYVLIGLMPKSKFRVEKWSFVTGHKVGELAIDTKLGLKPGEVAKTEPEGMDGKRFGMKVREGSARRLVVFKLENF